MKTWPHYSRNLLSKSFLGMVLWAIPTLCYSQTAPLAQPKSLNFPSAMDSIKKLTEFDSVRYKAKLALLDQRQVSPGQIEADTKIDLDPDFLNSILLNSKSSYLRLAGQGKCHFYSALMANLLKDSNGPVEKVLIQYKNKEGVNVSAYMTKPDFTQKVVFRECPETRKLVALFQLRTIDAAIKATSFELAASRMQCDSNYNAWAEDPKSPFWCQIHEILSSKAASKELETMAKLLRGKLGRDRIDYIQNFCTNADSSQMFCTTTFSSSFFSRIVDKTRSDIYIKDICQEALGKSVWTPVVARECVSVLKQNTNACLWGDITTSGLSPRPPCDQLSLALNHSSLWAEYDDCPRFSDSQSTTNLARLLANIEKPRLQPFSGACSAFSAATVLDFNRRFDNEAMWTAGVCYFDKIDQKEKCLPSFYGEYGNSTGSFTKVMAEVLTRTKGADRNTVCKMVSLQGWNPQLLEYKYGCFIVYDPDDCGIAHCNSKVFFNETEIKGLNLKTQLTFDYFPTSMSTEKFSQTYIIQRDAQKKTRALQTLPTIQTFFKENPKGVLHGIGCAEDLLPGFFKKVSLNQCTPLPFIIDGIVVDGDRSALVTRSAADDIHAPRLIPWSLVYSAVKSYQIHQPLKQWTLHALY